MLLVAVDPGKQGACVLVDTLRPAMRRMVTTYRMPLRDGEWCPWKMRDLILSWSYACVERVIIEECHAFPGISAHANASVMEAYGMWRAAIATKFLPEQVFIAPASVWKPAMDLVVPLVKAGKKATAKEKQAAYTARKAKSLVVARKEFGLAFATDRGRDLDGEAEAALLALYGSKL